MTDILTIARRAIELDAVATLGPWTYRQIPWKRTGVLDPKEGEVADIPYERHNDGDFIAFSRTALPALARAVIERDEALKAIGELVARIIELTKPDVR